MIKHAKFSYSSIGFPCTPAFTPHLQHLSSQIHISNQVKHLRWTLFAEIVDFFWLLIIFAEEFLDLLQDYGCDFIQ